MYGEVEFYNIAPRMLRSKRRRLENGDGCFDAESNYRAGDIASAGFAV